MILLLVRRLQRLGLFFCFQLSLTLLWPYTALTAVPAPKSPRELKERIEFDVKWAFIPLVKTYMETFRLQDQGGSALFLLTHQAALNTFWNDRMESLIDPQSLLPHQMETIIKDKGGDRREKIVFRRPLGEAMFVQEGPEKGQTRVDRIRITARSMDPLSAFYYLRKRLSPDNPSLELEGVTGSRRFVMRGELVGEESIQVPAGTYRTFRLECTLRSWKNGWKKGKKETSVEKTKSHPFTLWVTRDEQRFPVQIRYRLPLGSLRVQALTLEFHDVAT